MKAVILSFIRWIRFSVIVIAHSTCTDASVQKGKEWCTYRMPKYIDITVRGI